MASHQFTQTEGLRIACLECNAQGKPTALLLHSWPGRTVAKAGNAVAPPLSIPARVLRGAADTCNAPDTSLHREGFFLGRYQRQLLDHVGHFPQREAPQAVAAAILDFCRSS